MTPPRRHARGILDTSAFIKRPDSISAEEIPDEPLITAVTLAELSVGPLVTDDPRQRAIRQAQLQKAEANFDPLPFDTGAAQVFGRVSASLRGAGRKRVARSFDAMIAAIAIAHDLPVYTCNPEDFEGIEGLEVVAVNQP